MSASRIEMGNLPSRRRPIHSRSNFEDGGDHTPEPSGFNFSGAFFVAAMFFLLSPGVLLTLPPVGGKIFMSRKTSLAAAAVHAIVFILAIQLIEWLQLVYSEGFLVCGSGYTLSGGSCVAACGTNGQSGACGKGTCKKVAGKYKCA